jgi:hypothetical protein
MSKPRTRLVNFRVTDEEFERLKAASDRQSARSLSDFARCVMLTQHDICSVSGSYDDRFVSFDRRVASLERSMARLVEALSGSQLQRVNSGN